MFVTALSWTALIHCEQQHSLVEQAKRVTQALTNQPELHVLQAVPLNPNATANETIDQTIEVFHKFQRSDLRSLPGFEALQFSLHQEGNSSQPAKSVIICI
jgi:spore coat polysaccharide biosynthesis protein SpsF (cytidylyltransferase family)